MFLKCKFSKNHSYNGMKLVVQDKNVCSYGPKSTAKIFRTDSARQDTQIIAFQQLLTDFGLARSQNLLIIL